MMFQKLFPPNKGQMESLKNDSSHKYFIIHTNFNPMSTDPHYLQLTSHVHVDEASVLLHLNFLLISKDDQCSQARSKEYRLPV